MVLDFKVIILAEDIPVPQGYVHCLLQVSPKDCLRHLSGQAGAAADQPLVILLEKFPVNPP